MKLIKLYGKLSDENSYAMVDDDDYDYLMQWKWNVRKNNRNSYATRHEWHNGQAFHINMHKVVIDAKKGTIVDHVDRNGFNNQKKNLRLATHSQNMANRRVKEGGTSSYMGVRKKTIKRLNHVYETYLAQIQKDKKFYHIGSFKTEVEAAIAYDKKAKELHGEFANLNFM